MRILGCTVIRDEADIIELMVRHNLAFLDGLAVVDHTSSDGTSEILAALVAEGLPVTVTTDTNPKFRQAVLMNAMVRHWVLSSDIDWFVPIDADEFIVAPSRETLERTLAAVPAGRHAIVDWTTYLPSFGAGPLAERLAHPRRVTEPGHAFRKVVVPRSVMATPGIEVSFGNHAIQAIRAGLAVPEGVPLPLEGLSLAHVPIRSAAQFAYKSVSGWLSLVAQERRRVAQGAQWRDAFDAIADGEPVDDALLTRFAVNYSIPRYAWRETGDLVVDAPSFLQPVEERYAAIGRPRGLAHALKHAERLLTAPR
jgi:hypothetical protein